MRLKIEYPVTPDGKRTVRRNVYGNVVGYVSGKRFWEFGCDAWAAKVANVWLGGKSLEDAQLGE